jgi:hypothetical protein
MSTTNVTKYILKQFNKNDNHKANCLTTAIAFLIEL